MRSSVHQGSTAWLLLATLAFAVDVASAQGTCSIYWPPYYQPPLASDPVIGTVTQLWDPLNPWQLRRKLRIKKSVGLFSHLGQFPLGWTTGTPSLTGYSIVYLGQTFQLSDVHTSAGSGSYWYPRTATPYPAYSGFANLTLTYPCAITPVPPPPPTPVPTPPPPTPVPRPAGPTCTLYLDNAGPSKFPDRLRLSIRKRFAVLSDPNQPPLGWNGQIVALPGYIIDNLGVTVAVAGLWYPADEFYYNIQTATPYPEGDGDLWLTYPCNATPAPPPVTTPPPPTPVPRPAGPTCTLYMRPVTFEKYPDGLRLAIRKRSAVLSDPTQPPLGWNGQMVSLPGYIIDHLGVTVALAGLWWPSDAEFYYPQTASPFPEGDGDLLLSYPCNATPAPPPTICNAFWPNVGPANKSASLTRLSLFRASAVLSNRDRIPLGWVGGPPPNLSGYSLGHLGVTVDVAGLWDGPNPAGQYYNVETVSPFPADTGSALLVYPCAP